MLIPCFGIHQQRNDTLVFLHEEGGGRCLTPGLGALPSPFEVMTQRRGLKCPHEFGEPLDQHPIEHPFVRAMGPDQAGELFFVHEQHVDWIYRLAAMIPVRESLIEIVWSHPVSTLKHRVGPRLQVTNAAPLCLTEAAYRDFSWLEGITQVQRQRNLIISGGLAPPGSILLDPQGLDLKHDWPTEGRRQLHALIQKKSSP